MVIKNPELPPGFLVSSEIELISFKKEASQNK